MVEWNPLETVCLLVDLAELTVWVMKEYHSPDPIKDNRLLYLYVWHGHGQFMKIELPDAFSDDVKRSFPDTRSVNVRRFCTCFLQQGHVHNIFWKSMLGCSHLVQ
eukprot:scaffold667_cov103-Skeletonema_dohrnii-CCMP3373.AAC.9